MRETKTQRLMRENAKARRRYFAQHETADSWIVNARFDSARRAGLSIVEFVKREAAREDECLDYRDLVFSQIEAA